MESILSLLAPTLSFLAIPVLTSYSTSLNLLFFYLTWSTLLFSHSALKVEFIGTLAVRCIFYLFPALFFLLFDALLPSIARAVKQHGEVGIATQQADGKRWRNIMGISVFNLGLGVALQMGVECVVTKVLMGKSVVRITTTLPFPWAIGKDLLKGYAAREVYDFVSLESMRWNAD